MGSATAKKAKKVARGTKIESFILMSFFYRDMGVIGEVIRAKGNKRIKNPLLGLSFGQCIYIRVQAHIPGRSWW